VNSTALRGAGSTGGRPFRDCPRLPTPDGPQSPTPEAEANEREDLNAISTVDLRVGAPAIAAVRFELQEPLAETASPSAAASTLGVSYSVSSIARACLSQFANSFGSMSLSQRSLTWAMTFPELSSRPDGSSIEAPRQNPNVMCFDAALR
jgi:hypothetical protein